MSKQSSQTSELLIGRQSLDMSEAFINIRISLKQILQKNSYNHVTNNRA